MSSHVKAAAPKVKGRMSFKAVNQQRVGKPLDGGKRKRTNRRDDAEDGDTEADEDITDEGEEADGSEMEEEMDTDDELTASKLGKSKKTAKRKRRATSPSSFGATLQGLLGNADEEEADEEEGSDGEAGPSKKTLSAPVPVGQPAILSLAPHIRRGAQSSRLNEKAARLALAAKRKREDRARVTDVIGGWGAPGELPKTFEGDEKMGESSNEPMQSSKEEQQKLKSWLDEGGVQGYEKRLRKSAQRGVVKLFNAIRAAQNTTEADLNDEDGERKSTTKNEKAVKENNTQASAKRADNALGGKAKAVSELSKNNFFDLLRAGTKTK
ncbi:uncharacterized protein FA14DRAFT_159862 [Meira miltonrushii]|uniref:Rrp15p-domain-containing protein n=1 Tax=Meira miltonrushii TaxID=1280837 RepID=A0A316VM31_9BASI|nr:uncharacterized protein FA14DRAFT_159862 [Meira miltonrushii]PWN38148.1 hypothetical protein FA14DRAFT_159862 [Meira miltonrushii]